MATDIWINILGDSSKLKGELDKAGGHVKSFSEKIGKIGKVATVGGAAITAAFTKTFIDFTAYETKLVDMAKVTDEPFDKIEKKLGTLDPILGSSKELMSGYYQVISAGVKDPIKALETLRIASETGKAAHVAQSEVVKGITKVMAGYEGAIENVSVAADLMFSIEKEGQTSVAELIPYIGGLAKMSFDLAIGHETMGASMAVITKTAGSTAEAVTQYQAVLTGLMKPTEDMIGAIEDMGYATAEEAIAEEGLVEVLKHLEEYMERTGTSAAKLFGRKEAMMGFSALGAEGFKVLDDTIVSVGKGMGGAEKAFDEWSKSGEASMADMKNTFLNFSTDVGAKVAPMIKELLGSITNVISKVSEWAEENPKLFETIVKVAAVIGALAAVGGPILMAVSAFSAVAPAIALIGTIATGPIGLLIIAVTAIIAVWKNWDKIVEFVSGFVEKIIQFLVDLKNMAIEKVTEMIDWIIEKFKDLADLPKKMLEWGKNAVIGFADGIKSKIGDVTDAVKGVGNKILGFLGFESPPKEGPLSGSDKWMPNMMTMFGEGITSTEYKVIEPVGALTMGIMEIFEKLKNDFKSNIVDPIVGYLENQLTYAITGLLGGVEDFEWSWKSFWEGLKKTLIDAVAAMIAKLIILATFKWLFPWLGFETGGGVGYQFGGEVKKFQFGGMADTIPARLTVGEYVISKPMTDFIKRFKAIPQNLVNAVIRGLPTPTPAFAGGGPVGTSNITSTSFGETKIYVDIHDNRISDDVDIKRLAATVSNEILRKINLNRRH